MYKINQELINKVGLHRSTPNQLGRKLIFTMQLRFDYTYNQNKGQLRVEEGGVGVLRVVEGKGWEEQRMLV